MTNPRSIGSRSGRVKASRSARDSGTPAAAREVADQRVLETSELGAIFTKRWVAELVLDLADYSSDRALYTSSVIEPACGDGAFLSAIVERVIASATRDHIDLSNYPDTVIACDVDPRAVANSRSLVTDLLLDSGMSVEVAAGLAERWVRQGDFLKIAPELPESSWVVGNPPYVRIEDISRNDIVGYRNAWKTMSGRADIYVGFYEAGLSKLRPDGRLAYICADRWMRNRYGAALRTLVEEHHAMETCVVMHAVDAFEDRVAAYPAITVIANHQQGDALVAEASPEFDAAGAARLVKTRSRGPAPVIVDRSFRASWLPSWPKGPASWPAGAPERLQLIADLERRFPTLEETGAYVAVGIATGADDVYVVSDSDVVEERFIHPALAARETALGGIDWRGRYLIAPWDDGGLVDLEHYPGLKDYLLKHKPRLLKRHIARNNPERWWRTIDRVDNSIALTPKLLIPDLKDRIHPVYDQGRYMPLHSLYYITSEEWDLAVLGGLLMSRLANLFVEAYSVRMANGYMRVSAQYLRRIRVPEPSHIARASQDELRAAFWSRDVEAATVAAFNAYGLSGQALV